VRLPASPGGHPAGLGVEADLDDLHDLRETARLAELSGGEREALPDFQALLVAEKEHLARAGRDHGRRREARQRA
jgi:hypothetical protein